MLSVGLLRTRSNALEIPHRAHRHVWGYTGLRKREDFSERGDER
jgi:hypothetical protein